MANQEHLNILKQGVEFWNAWRQENPEIQPDLSRADLQGADLKYVDFRDTNLQEARCDEADFDKARMDRARLYLANLRRANLYRTICIGADMREAILRGADLVRADLSDADLRKADLKWVKLGLTDFSRADLRGCRVYAICAWNVILQDAKQDGLVITDDRETILTVDNLEVAQFIYLLMYNPKIREVIDTISKKVVLILGNFEPRRKAILDAIRAELRCHNYVSVVFDFERPNNRNFTETVSAIAHLSRFVIADLTTAKSIPQELERIVPRLQVPVQPLLHVSENKPYIMEGDFHGYQWYLPLYRYQNKSILLRNLERYVIKPAEEKANEFDIQRNQHDRD